MGWKALKQHYSIEHIVAKKEETILCIGSAYVHDLIRIDCVGRKIEWGSLGPSKYDDLTRYWQDFHADLEQFWSIVDSKDSFSRSLPVFTYENGEIIERQCETYDWPNVTHCGWLMYDNRYFRTKKKALNHAIRDAELGVKFAARYREECEQKLTEAKADHIRCLDERTQYHNLLTMEGD